MDDELDSEVTEEYEYTTDRGVTVQVFRGLSGYRMVQITGEDGRVQMKLLDVPRLIQALTWALSDEAKARDEAKASQG